MSEFHRKPFSLSRATSLNRRRVNHPYPFNPMKRLLAVALILCSILAANAELTLKEIRTASKNVLVAYFKSTVILANEVNTSDPAAWKLNGQPVTALNKFVTEADACDHHIYLQVPELVNGTTTLCRRPTAR